jgi:hypothetical protein
LFSYFVVVYRRFGGSPQCASNPVSRHAAGS